MNIKYGIGVSVLVLGVALSLTGCGKKGEEAKTGQVAAKVNGDQITQAQVDFELKKLGNVSPDQSQQVAEHVLKGLVDQQLLMKQAVEQKLDQEPQVAQALDESRRQILAKAYVSKITQDVPAPTDAEIKDYYAKNPALFSERRIYKLQQLVIQVTPKNMASIKDKLAAAKNLGEFIQWLKAQKIPVQGGEAVKAAEQLPLELLPRLQTLKDGQYLAITGNDRLTVLFLAGSQTEPLSEAQAKPVIERYLTNAKKREMVQAELKKLRDAAKIQYLGEYADLGKAAEPPASQEAAPTPPSAQPEPKMPAKPAGDQNKQGTK
jgi:EpsD family peptidyl-prolyl cis-trans isomerase